MEKILKLKAQTNEIKKNEGLQNVWTKGIKSPNGAK